MQPLIYVLKNTFGLSKTEKAFFLQHVDKAKIERINQCRFPEKAEGMLLAEALCKTAISNAFGIPIGKQHFVYTENGKPVLKGFENVYFSWSHSGNRIACAVSKAPVGIDIEKIGNFPKKVAARVCSDAEFSFILESEHKASAFTKLWTMKEAAVKLRGTGIFGEDLKTCLCGTRVESMQMENYWLSVATYDAR